ncbi:MAG: hypothetical protein EBZ50_13235 [Alphaproteobacteria bacterium]|nr:hypothetical protein [Alphaproteobacteria bacterium]
MKSGGWKRRFAHGAGLLIAVATLALSACDRSVAPKMPADALEAEAFQVEQGGLLSLALKTGTDSTNTIVAQVVCDPQEKIVFAVYKFRVGGDGDRTFSTDIVVLLDNKAFPLSGGTSSTKIDEENGGFILEQQQPIDDPKFMAALKRARLLEIKSAGQGIASPINREWIEKFLKTCPPDVVTPKAAAGDDAVDGVKGLSGEWRGYYAEGDAKTPFEMSLTAVGSLGEFRGASREPNQTGRGGPLQVGALIHGYVHDDGSLVFDKTYDGSAGLSHTVSYRGRVSEGGAKVQGEWRVEARTGAFAMTRD